MTPLKIYESSRASGNFRFCSNRCTVSDMKKPRRASKRVVVAVSGGFDPVHFGHIRLMREARKLGTELVVILNNDNWLKAKKGFVFMGQKERKEILEALDCVDRVEVTRHKPHDTDRSVVKDLARIRPDIFANGGDRKTLADIPEVAACRKYGIEMIFGVGRGGKVQSSSWLTGKIANQGTTDVRPWGYMQTHKAEPHFWTKTITVAPNRRLSLQLHNHRSETWVCVEGEVVAEVGKNKKVMKPGMTVTFPPKTKHRLSSIKGGTIVEVAFGTRVAEDDIVRLADDYGRV